MLLHTYTNNNYLELYNKWYVDKINKNIPNDIIRFFNEESLAYLVMSEGKIKNRKLSLNMNQYSNRDIKIFKELLENKFKLDQVNLKNNYLEFNTKNICKIYKLTKPYILPSMKFKFLV
jgi:transcriptional regulator of heat shock response